MRLLLEICELFNGLNQCWALKATCLRSFETSNAGLMLTEHGFASQSDSENILYDEVAWFGSFVRE